MARINWSLLAQLARLSQLAYESLTDISSALQAGEFRYVPGSFKEFYQTVTFPGLELPGFHVPLTIAVKSGVFAAISNDVLVISFRGTDGVGDVVVDGRFAAEVKALGYSPTLLRYAAQFVDHVRLLISNADAGTPVVFTGHSLGGMVAEQFTQWFFDPLDPHDLHAQDFSVSGVGFGSPGVMDVEWASDGGFLHVAHAQDNIGTYASADHIGPSLILDDPESNSLFMLKEHRIARYLEQVEEISVSPLASFLQSPDLLLFLPDGLSNSTTVGSAYDAVFGGERSDTIASDGGHRLLAEGGDGNDYITGGDQDDILSGGRGDDYIAGGDGLDRLFGGEGGDRYSIGVYQGYNIISDLGGSGQDIIALSSGSVFDRIDYGWFSVDGNDLLVRGYAPDGVLVINIRIVNMSSRSGSVELFNLYAGDGRTLTQSWDLGALWIGLGQPPAAPDRTVSGGAQSGVFTSGDDQVVRGEGDQTLTTHGQGQDYVDMGGGEDTLILDYSALGTSVYTSWFGPFGYSSSVGAGTAYNVERVVLIGGAAADRLWGAAGDDILTGELGNDELVGGSGDDTLLGGGGDDSLWSGQGADWIDGGSGDDQWNGDLSDEVNGIAFLTALATSDTGLR